VAGTEDGGHCDLANAVAGAVALVMQSGIQDENGTVVIRGYSMTDLPIHGESFADVFTPKQSVDDWLHDR
jgi:hypothetical protein